MSRSPHSIVEVCRQWAARVPQRVAYTVLHDGEAIQEQLTYERLDARARAIAAVLQQHTRPGDRALLLYPSGVEYVAAFMGCLYAKVVAVPAYPVRAREARWRGRLEAVARDATPRVALTVSALREAVDAGGADERAQAAARGGLRIVCTDEVDEVRAAEWRELEVEEETLAFLQYTSGTTSTPRGVMVTHGNLLHQEAMLQHAFGQREQSVIVSWLPLYHDMGLIGSVLQTLYSGAHGVLMSPAAFLQRPLRWLQAIHTFRGTTSGGPNFAYDLCVRKSDAAERASLDLSTWEVAFNGSELARPDTMARFARAFEPCGFRSSAFRPCYGLAEATLMVSACLPPAADDEAPALKQFQQPAPVSVEDAPARATQRTLVTCGPIGGDQHVAIVSVDTGMPCAPGEIGEVWVHGGSVAHGYWRRDKETTATFRARTADAADPREYLRTGDLGLFHEGELFIAGRLKDVIIIRGRNHFSEDLEDTIERTDRRFRPGTGVACEIEHEGEARLLVVQEIDPTQPQDELTDAVRRLRRALVREHGLSAHAIVLVEPRSLPKTPSGKNQRRACAEDFLNGRLKVVASSVLGDDERPATSVDAPSGGAAAAPADPERFMLEAYLRDRAARLLGTAAAGLQTTMPLSEAGLDSLRATELQAAIEAELRVELPLSDILDGPSIEQLADRLLALRAEASRSAAPASDHPRSAAASSPDASVGPALLQEAMPRRARMSEGQRSMWFVESLASGRGVYTIARAARLDRAVDESALWQALRDVVTRHEALRTTFPAGPTGEPEARIHARLEPELATQDASTWDEPTLRAAMESFAGRAFDLEQGPLVRAALFHRADAAPLLVLALHHIITDLWSLCVLLEEVGAIYTARVSGRSAALPLVVESQDDGIARQEQLLEGPAGARMRDYWQAALSGPIAPIDLSAGRPRPDAVSFAGRTEHTRIAPPLAQALRALGEQRQATLYMVLLAAFQVFLHRYTGQPDIIVGSPFHGRRGTHAARTVGYLTNLLPLRAIFGTNPRFVEHLADVARSVRGALDHQEYPFHRLVDALHLRREPGRAPLCNVVCTFQAAPAGGAWPAFAMGEPGARLTLGALTLESMPLATATAAFDLTLTIAPVGDDVALAWNYRDDLFDADAIRAMARHFDALLRNIVENPAKPVRHYPLTTASEVGSIIALGAPVPAVRAHAGLHERFEEIAARQARTVAVVDGDVRLSYGDLNARANRLARALRARGVRQESRVGIYLERSADVVISVLAVLKAGGAYVPIDPAYPAARVAFMLSDAGVRLVLTESALAERLAETGVECVCLDSDTDTDTATATGAGRAAADAADDANPGLRTWPQQLAYVIYTSGSTGTPKGTLVEHRQVTRLFTETEPLFAFGPADVWTLFHSHAFDFSVWELWGALLYGGRLVIVSYAVSRAPERFHALLEQEQITVLNQTPSAFRLLTAVDGEEARRALRLSLRLVIFGGEALDPGSVHTWLTRHGEDRPTLVNMYGITETTVHVTAERLTLALLAGGSASATPIGRPLPDLQIYLLDEAQQLVPQGVPGEICVGGAGVTRGYGGRAALTAARFVPDPFGPPGARLYRSGDQARFLADGTLRYLGRLDDQVKIRGFRVELGEIEATLRLHPRVADCRVIASDDAAEERRLIAYIVWSGGEPGTEPNAGELRAHAAKTLADYLLPQAFVFLDRMPLTAHGKLDRAALPAPSSERPAQASSPVPPATPDEQTLCRIWEQVLGVQQVGTADNFFELGGDSIRCLQVVSQARAAGLPVTVQQMLQHQTVGALAAILRGAADAEQALAPAAPFSALSSEDRVRLGDALAFCEDAYPLTTVQAGLVFHSEYEPDYVVYSVSVTLRAPYDPARFHDATAILMRRHALLRTSYDMTTGAEPLQLVHRDVPVPLVVEDCRHLAKAERDQLLAAWIEREKRQRFDWSAPPLFRVYLHRLDEETFQFTFSHSLFDGWSTAIASTELFEIYFGLLRGESPTPEGPATAFREFVSLERQTLRSDEAKAFWTRTLSGEPQGSVPRWPAPARDELPVRRSFTMPGAVFDGLVSFARTAQVPLKSVFLAAHVRVLSLLTGQPDVVTGVITNGRVEGVGTDRVLGMFLNAVPLRLTLKGGSWRDLVQGVFAAEQQVFPFRRYPFAELQRQHGRQPMFETAFNIINFHVYRDLVRDTGLQVVDRLTSYDQTFFALTAYFEVDAFSTEAYVHLDVNSRDIGDDQLAAIQAYYALVLAAMATTPSSRYESTATLREEERASLLGEWCDTQAAYPARRVDELFRETARRRPRHVAVKSRGRELTYEQLERLADRVARRLAAEGVGPESVVAICVERSVDMLAALLGILTAGAAYLPLDPTLPPDRLAYMLADSGARFVLVGRGLLSQLPDARPSTIVLEEALAEPELAPDGAVAPDAGTVTATSRSALAAAGTRRSSHPATLAYVIYTSGSTGAPKGVQVVHQALTNLVTAIAREPGFVEDDVLLALTTLSFDIAGLELFVPIVCGGTVVIGEQVDLAADALQQQIAQSGATMVQATPTTWRLLVESGWPGDARLTLLSGGEPLPRDLAAALLDRCGTLWNMYGPTETTIWSTYGRVRPEAGAVTIGRPLANTIAYVLDAHLRPVPIGASGTLYLAGTGLARGYVGRAALTADRLCPHPFGDDAGSRMYDTGDLARMRPDGAIELLGRGDQQVKIRGFRIEPGEIEAALLAHPAVTQAAVIPRAYGAGDVRLVAFVAPASEALPAPAVLRQLLKRTLPEYMVPALFVPLDRLPVTANGKLDRRALSRLDCEPAAPALDAAAPLTPLEQQLARIWEAILERAPIGAHQDFFELGGHSLLAMRVISRMRLELDLPIPLTALFDASTIAGLAAIVEAVQADEDAEVDSILQEIDTLSDQQVLDRLFARDRLSLSDPA